jgi:hypothetical protein
MHTSTRAACKREACHRRLPSLRARVKPRSMRSLRRWIGLAALSLAGVSLGGRAVARSLDVAPPSAARPPPAVAPDALVFRSPPPRAQLDLGGFFDRWFTHLPSRIARTSTRLFIDGGLRPGGRSDRTSTATLGLEWKF